jgi:hypothetical protein
MKKTLLLATAGMLASASCFAGFTPSYNGGQYVATVTAPGGSMSVSEAIPGVNVAPGPIGALARSAYGVRDRLRQAILAQLTSVTSTGSSISVYPVIHGTITASLTGLTGAYAGYNQLRVGGATTTATISSPISIPGLNPTCITTVTFSNVQFAATYNPTTGQMLDDPAVTYANLNPSTSVSCSTNLDWVPFIGTMVDSLVANEFNAELQSTLVAVDQNLVSSVFPTATAQIGIDTVLKPGQFVIGGVDWGAYIDNNFGSLFTGKSLTVSMAEYLPPTKSTNALRQPNDLTVDTKSLVVDFSDGARTLKVSIDDIEDFTWDYTCTSSLCTKPD